MRPHIEIERKFLVVSKAWRAEVVESVPIVQLYLALTDRCHVRARRYGSKGFVTVKGIRTGISRTELETEVPTEFVDTLLTATELHAAPPLIKTRHLVTMGEFRFEIDEYAGDNAGLTVAEVELSSVDSEFPRPDWLGREITHDGRYGNAYLAQRPYRAWGSES